MHEVGRDELSETAELATSELVTNAVLHARTAISVVVDVNGADVRIEIRDGSAITPLQPTLAESPTDQNLPCVGNGLRILGSVTHSWGVREQPGVGKAIWFVPAPGTGTTTAAATGGSERPVAEDMVSILLLDAPVTLLWCEMSRCRDLSRELALVLLGDPSEGPADPLANLARSFMQMYEIDVDTWQRLKGAFDRGETRIDLSVRLIRARTASGATLGHLLDSLDELSRTDDLLTVPASYEAAAVRGWVLTEISRQAAGAPALPWSA